MTLEGILPNRGILPDALATVVSTQWFGSEALELTYKDPSGRVATSAAADSARAAAKARVMVGRRDSRGMASSKGIVLGAFTLVNGPRPQNEPAFNAKVAASSGWSSRPTTRLATYSPSMIPCLYP